MKYSIDRRSLFLAGAGQSGVNDKKECSDQYSICLLLTLALKCIYAFSHHPEFQPLSPSFCFVTPSRLLPMFIAFSLSIFWRFSFTLFL